MIGLLLKSALIVAGCIALLVLYRILRQLSGISGAVARSRHHEFSWAATHMLFSLACWGIIVAEVYLPIRLVAMIVRFAKGEDSATAQAWEQAMPHLVIGGVLVFILWKIFCGFRSSSPGDLLSAGTGGGIAKNATILYEKIRRRRPDLPENHARFLAMFINSHNARDDMPVELLRKLLERHVSDAWESLCASYAIEYWERVGGEDVTALSPNARAVFFSDIHRGIDDGQRSVKTGNTLYDDALRVLDAPSFLRDIINQCERES